jgi:hypothetical protein
MQDAGFDIPRTSLLGTSVNKGKRKGRSSLQLLPFTYTRFARRRQRLPVELASYGPVGELVVVHVDVEGPRMLP